MFVLDEFFQRWLSATSLPNGALCGAIFWVGLLLLPTNIRTCQGKHSMLTKYLKEFEVLSFKKKYNYTQDYILLRTCQYRYINSCRWQTNGWEDGRTDWGKDGRAGNGQASIQTDRLRDREIYILIALELLTVIRCSVSLRYFFPKLFASEARKIFVQKNIIFLLCENNLFGNRIFVILVHLCKGYLRPSRPNPMKHFERKFTHFFVS